MLDDLATIAILVKDARSAGEQEIDARDHGVHEEAASREADRRFAVARIYMILGVEHRSYLFARWRRRRRPAHRPRTDWPSR